jgi:hypothetical protein
MTRTLRLPAVLVGAVLVALFALGIVALARPLAVQAVACDTSWTNTTVSGNWTDSAKWDNGIPDSTKNTCIPAGSYTVTIPGVSVAAKTLTVGTGATLALEDLNCNGGGDAVLTMSGDLTNAGTVGLRNSTDGCGGEIHLTIPSGSSLTNDGTIDTNGSSRGLRRLTGSVTNNGSVTVTIGCYACDPKPRLQLEPETSDALFDNRGAVSIASQGAMTVLGVVGNAPTYEFRNSIGGSIDGSLDVGNCPSPAGSGPCTSSGAKEGSLIVYGGNTFTENAGTTTGNPVDIDGDGDTLHFTGSGASTFALFGSNTLSGSAIASGQTVYLDDSGCGPRSSIATLTGSMTNGGNIYLHNWNDACGGTAKLAVPGGSTLTNNGTIQTIGCCRGNRELSGDVTNSNSGTVEVSHSFSYPNVATLTIDPGTFDNHGTVTVDDDRRKLSVVGDTLIAELDGTIGLNSTGQYAQDSAATLAVFIDALDTTNSGITGGTGCSPSDCTLAGTLKVTTIGEPAKGSSWPIIAGTTSGTFSNCSTNGATCAFDGTDYTIHYGSVTLEAAANDVTTSTPSSTTGTVTAIPNTGVPAGSSVYDQATVTGNDSSQNPTGSVGFYICSPGVLSANSSTTCSDSFGTLFDTETLSGGSGGTVSVFSTGQTASSAGTWCFAAYYAPDGASPYPASHDAASDECFLVTAAAHAPAAALTRGACAFDLDAAVPGSTFRLIFTPDTATTYRLAASNPGELFYNAFATGTPNSAGTVTVTLPYPFITKGSGFVHIYDAVSGTPACDQPAGNEIPLGGPAPTAVSLSSYGNSPTFATTAGLTVHFTFDSTGLAFVRVHLDYGLKGRSGYAKDAHNNAVGSPTINDKRTYAFSDSAGGSATGSSENVFKRDPGIGGLVLKSVTGDPLANVTVRVYDGSGKLLGTVVTDQDGWYAWTCKFSGKTVTYTVKLPAYNLAQTVTTKSNTLVVVSFTVP